MTTHEELTQLIADFSNDLAGLLHDPAGWGIYLSYLLEELERQAAESGQPLERYDLALELLARAATERIEAHKR